MRKVVAATFVSLDGVMQAPGGPEEDPTGGFRFGGWTAPWFDEEVGAAVDEAFSDGFDLLLGRRTYDIFAAHWPYIETDPSKGGFDAGEARIAQAFNSATKYVATHSPDTLSWKNSQWLGADVIAAVQDLKKQDGPKLLIQGSSELIHQLMAERLVDEIRLLIFPVVLGKGKRVFDDSAAPSAMKLTSSRVSKSGVVAASYTLAGDVKTGSFAAGTPSAAELERRKKLGI